MTVPFKALVGKLITRMEGAELESEEVTIHCDDGTRYTMYHDQDCCEHVRLYEIHGDVSDLIGTHLLQADESSEETESSWGSGTWTFYKFATAKGYVTLRWLGESNGYYSESVTLYERPAP